MKTGSLFYLFLAGTLPLMACGILQAGIATQTVAAGTMVAASRTATPTLVPTETFTPSPTATPDPCTPENLPEAVDEVHDLMVQFEDLSGIAANTEREALPEKIAELKSLLQTADEQEAPPCLQTLKDHQLKHMDLVIDTLIVFVDGGSRLIFDGMIERAREEHDAYTLEYDRLLGNTPTP